MAALRPTTKAQISGHRFLRRRVEHGLVMGDIRMLHDPLGRRRRALVAGIVMSIVMAAGAGIIAWLSPHPTADGATIVRTEQGQLFAHLDETFYPVPNLVSAQLIVGQPDNPVKVAELGKLGTPVGIPGAPGFLNPVPAQTPWTLCTTEKVDEPEFISQISQTSGTRPLVVHADLDADPLAGYALLENDGVLWLLQSEGVTRMPGGTLGDAVKKGLEISPAVPRWHVTDEFISSFEQLPDFAVAPELPAVWDTGQGLLVRTGEGVAPITSLQARILIMLGAQEATVAAVDASNLPLIKSPVELPSRKFEFLNADAGWLCSTDGRATHASEIPGAFPLVGSSPITHFGGLSAGGVAVDTGHGRLVVSATGTRHLVTDEKDWRALGLAEAAEVPWKIVRLLPSGAELSRASALKEMTSASLTAAK
ncbi:hypothetical protein CPHO_10270 [Corynebacterium phocae]|uniref:Type VII secretion protein EccB n=1 Tax=Corynebacterium phocae TaxID=161895 RepID=A0A1L7D515_9CORY|nr:type VII secretion protein EccB [Corynebacterium phocae]APT93210.1 hypothetical protein CPHO_10270 [Corynebacterium phocae]KAA8721950.1 type VII secretion protein EccB [Corynebacterium phocae]